MPKKKSAPTSNVFAIADPWHMALFMAFQSLTPAWKQWKFQELDDIDNAALERIVGVGLAEARIGGFVRPLSTLAILEAIFLARGDGVGDAVVNELRDTAGKALEIDNAECELRTFTMAVRLTAGATSIHRERRKGTALILTVQKIAENDSLLKPADVSVEEWRVWRPSELQAEIWNELKDGKGATADKLEGRLSVARGTLFKKPGGLPELLELGFVKNDRGHGGYYRPDKI